MRFPTRTLALAIVALAVLPVASPLARADHTRAGLRALMDTGVAVVVTEDGMPEAEVDYREPIVVFSAEEYLARFEHPDDPLAQIHAIAEILTDMPGAGWTDAVLDPFQEPGVSNHNDPPYSMLYSGGTGWHWHARAVPASDAAHNPYYGCNWAKTDAGLARFQSNFGDEVVRSCYSSDNCWDASNINGENPGQLLDDLAADIGPDGSTCGWLQDQRNEVVFGWVEVSNNNGIAYADGHFAIGAETTGGYTDWDHDEIVQHEVSHNFDAPDRGTWWWEGDGIMNYYDAFNGVDWWATDDFNIVRDNIYGCISACTE